MRNIMVIGSCFTSNQEQNRLEKQGFVINRIKSGMPDEYIKSNLIATNSNILIIGGSTYIKHSLVLETGIKYIFFAGTNYESSMERKLIEDENICICNAPYLNSDSVAELIIAMLFNANFNMYNHFVNSSNFVSNRELRRDISSLNIGIIGLGHIGYRVAKILKNGFNVGNLFYFSRSRKDYIESEIKIKYIDFDSLISRSDVIILTCSENPTTVNMITKKELKNMKNNVIIINAARPHLINGYDLQWALSNNVVGSVSFDGYYVKPIPMNKEDDKYGLFQFINDKLFITPYIGSSSITGRNAIDRFITNKILLIDKI